MSPTNFCRDQVTRMLLSLPNSRRCVSRYPPFFVRFRKELLNPSNAAMRKRVTATLLNLRKSQPEQVSHLSPRLFTTSPPDNPITSTSTSTAHITRSNPRIDFSSIKFSGIAQSVISKCSSFFDKCKPRRVNFVNGGSLKDLLLELSDVIPHITRRFRRVSRLEPEHVVDILLGFQFECERVSIEGIKVESLWEIFKWASAQDKGFKHLPKSCEVMSSVLVRYGMFREVQLLLLTMERQGIQLGRGRIFSSLVEGYVDGSDLERAVLVYDQMREQGLVPSVLCYCGLIDLSVKMKRTKLAFRVCLDMLEDGINLSSIEIGIFENFVRLLCGDGMVQEARNFIKKSMVLGFEPSNLVLDEIACGYCEKRDFEDLFRFLVEMKASPSVLVGNKIIFSLCRNFGVERANFLRREMEDLGYRPDEITFGILIGWCCVEGNLRTAFFYLSEMLSRGQKPDVLSYNSLIGMLFKKGMWKHVQNILDEMMEKGTTPDLSTFKILLAGYCKARQFDEAKMIVQRMVNQGLIESSSPKDPLSIAFRILGFNPLSVSLKRDNDVRCSKTEFFDNLGNGMYLDTDLDEYEKMVTAILEASLMPDFNVLLNERCNHGNYKAAIWLIDEMARWGQEQSLSVFSALVKGLCTTPTRSNVKACSGLLEKMLKLANQLDREVLNLLIQAYCKNGLGHKGWIIFNQMLQRNLTINNGTYTAVMMGLCKKQKLRDLHDCWDLAQNDKWFPRIEDCNSLVECLCCHGMLKEVLELLESMLASHNDSTPQICHVFLEKLSITGFTSVAQVLAKELLQQGCPLGDIAYSNLIRGLLKERKYTDAFTILETMLSRKLVPCLDVSLTLIPQLCRANRLEKAIALRESALREQPTSFSVHSDLIKGFCMVGEIEEAANVFQDMLSKGLFPDGEIYNMLFQGYCRANNMRKGREILSVITRKCLGLSIPSFRSWMRLMCSDGRIICVLSMKELMLGDSKADSLIIYNILLFYLLAAGNNVLVGKVLSELQEKGLPLNEVTYNFLIYGFFKCEDIPACLHYLSTMILKGFKPSYHNLRTVITTLCENGELGKVLDWSREMELRGWVHGTMVQNAIVEGLLFHGKIQEAENFLDRMLDKGLIPKTINYDNLIKCFCSRGRLNKAVDLLDIMLKKGNLPNSSSYDSIVHRLCMLNQLNHAMDFHTEMLDKDLKPSINTWDALVQKLCQQGRTAEAEKMVISMAQLGETPTRLMYSSVIDMYRFEKNMSKALELMQLMQQSGYEPDFDTHWSLISNLSDSKGKDDSKSQGFLTRLLSGSGFFLSGKESNTKLR